MSITLPPLPRPADCALISGNARQGSEMRLLSHDYEPSCAQYTHGQMQAYAITAVEADRARRVPMTDAQLRELVPYWLGYDLVEQFGLLELMRAVEAHHGIGAKP